MESVEVNVAVTGYGTVKIGTRVMPFVYDPVTKDIDFMEIPEDLVEELELDEVIVRQYLEEYGDKQD